MPRGRWASGSGLGGSACPRRIARFLEPCLLLLLRGDATHGYSLLEALRQFGFVPGAVDASVVYRILREMEDAGWVSSQWDTAGSGPPRRVYTVTPDGEEYLSAWINDLRCTRDEIDQFIETYTHQDATRQQSETSAAG
ncbi:MAG: helix-turn-helix transcriptional regulator [Alphaproteobacteria bacterium]|nr:helix-turn-helix transcriptional regulator [Alphaproteobacteria bacterium]